MTFLRRRIWNKKTDKNAFVIHSVKGRKMGLKKKKKSRILGRGFLRPRFEILDSRLNVNIWAAPLALDWLKYSAELKPNIVVGAVFHQPSWIMLMFVKGFKDLSVLDAKKAHFKKCENFPNRLIIENFPAVE